MDYKTLDQKDFSEEQKVIKAKLNSQVDALNAIKQLLVAD